ncbi:hypothetical protein PUN28_014921 [Cardiocondyla obscurior]|uniref:Uncharacterized protein n=1 Tax=Cardiocondyla obscurior TaxID=286306 RepID=A0AAW2F166_9HYME
MSYRFELQFNRSRGRSGISLDSVRDDAHFSTMPSLRKHRQESSRPASPPFPFLRVVMRLLTLLGENQQRRHGRKEKKKKDIEKVKLDEHARILLLSHLVKRGNLSFDKLIS